MMVPGFLSTFFCKMLILVHNFNDFYLLGCASPQFRLRYSSTYTKVVMLKHEGWKKQKIFYPFKTIIFQIFSFGKPTFVMLVIGSSFESSGCISSYTSLLKSGQTLSAPRNISFV